jgi:TolB-like protein/Flp pilus assembly protein TadD
MESSDHLRQRLEGALEPSPPPMVGSPGPAPSLAGRELGSYRVLRELGRGGMSTVYLADDPRHDRRVAIKVLHPDLAAAIGPERFRREIRLAARLQHPHILAVFDSGETEGHLWYVMPFVEGESLRDRLRRERRLPVNEAIRIAREIALALEYAHRHGVVHRDVKPENVLLDAGGEVLLADFGIARALDAGDAHLTGSGMAIGTPLYMSPEQAEGTGEVDGRSDQYGLGCVLYEMLAGEPPFVGLSLRSVLLKRLTAPAPDVAVLREAVPPRVRDALRRALSRHPSDRFPSAAAFADVLLETTPSPHAATAATAATASGPAAPASSLEESDLLRARRRILSASVALAAAVAAATFVGLRVAGAPVARAPAGEGAGVVRLAVLPFRNLGGGDDDYFADGLTEEVTSRLGAVQGLRVISRTSAQHYRQTDKTLRQVGAELGVGYVLEGSVRWEGRPAGTGRVRVTPRLVRVSDDTQLWGDRFDAELADVFEVQTGIAEAVAAALDVHLGGEERAALAQRPTASLDAYDAFLRANVYLDRGWNDIGVIDSALGQYRRAVGFDPAFADAWARLSIAQTMRYRRTAGAPDSLLVRAKAAADTAFRLAPDLGTGHLAMGYYHYWGKRDYTRARSEFAAVLQRRPSDADALYGLGAVSRRQGRWDAAVANLCRAADIDPRSSAKAWDCGLAAFFTRDYPAAERYLDRSIVLDPSNAFAYTTKARLELAWREDTNRAREILRGARRRVDLATLASGINDAAFLLADSSWIELEQLTPKDFEDNPIDYFAWKGAWYRARGKVARERAAWDSMRVAAGRAARERPTSDEPWVGLALAYAGLGQAEETRWAIARAEEVLPPSRDHAWGADRAVYFTQCYARLGDTDRATALLEGLLATPSPLSPGRLRVDPAYAPLRSDVRFRRLIGKAP